MVYDVYRKKINKIYNVYKLDIKRYPACCDKKNFSHIIYSLDQLETEPENNKSKFFVDFEFENIGYEKFAKKTVEGSARYTNGMHYRIGDKIFIENRRYEIVGEGTGVLYVDEPNIVEEIGKDEAYQLYNKIINKYGYEKEQNVKKTKKRFSLLNFFKK